MWKHFATSDFPGEYNVKLFWRTVDRIHTYVLPTEIKRMIGPYGEYRQLRPAN